MRYVIIGNERKQCRAKNPDHCRYHKGITHYKTKDAADKALDMEMGKKTQKRLMKTSDAEHYSPKQSMAARYEDLREVDDSEVGWSEDDATKYDEKTQRQPVGLDMNHMYTNISFMINEKNLKKMMIGKKIDTVVKRNELTEEEDDGYLRGKILMEDKTQYDLSYDYDDYDGYYDVEIKDFNNNGEAITDIIKTELPNNRHNDDEEYGYKDDIYDLTVMTKDGPIMKINVSGYTDVSAGPDADEKLPLSFIMVCGQKTTEPAPYDYIFKEKIDNAIDDSRCRGWLHGIETDEPSTAIAAKMRINDCDVNGKKTPVVTEFLIEPKDGDGTPVIKNVETVLPNGERVRNKTVTSSVKSIILDKQGLDDSVTNTLYNANKNNENVEIRAIGFYNTKE